MEKISKNGYFWSKNVLWANLLIGNCLETLLGVDAWSNHSPSSSQLMKNGLFDTQKLKNFFEEWQKFQGMAIFGLKMYLRLTCLLVIL